MSRWADWFAVDLEEAQRFRDAAASGSQEQVTRLLEPWLDSEGSESLRVSMDKAWEPIHRCLTDDHSAGLDFAAGSAPLNHCVFGGALLLDRSRTATLITAEEVAALSAALDEIGKEELRASFMALPGERFHAIDAEAFEWMWEHFEQLRTFFATAEEAGQAVVCTVSH